MAASARLWPEADLVRRLCDVLDVAANAIERLAPEGFTDSEEPANSLRPEKVIGESGLLLLAASTAAHHAPVRRRVDQLAGRLAPHARSERLLVAMCTQPALAWDYALGHVCLKRIGHPDRRFDAVLKLISHAQARDGRERPPHRVLEQMWVAKGAQLRRSANGAGRLPEAALDSVLCRPMDLINASRDDVYAFTHALMYVTDFNIRPWRLPRRRSEILADAEAALARCLDEQDYDLAGELLLAWPLTGRSWCPSAVFAFRVLARVEDEAGFLPSSGTRPERLNKLTGDDRARYLLATAYHTVYVMGLLCSAALQPSRRPPIRIAVGRRHSQVSELLRSRLDADPQRPHWWKEMGALSGQEREALCGLLLAVGFRRSVMGRDFARLRDFLEIGRENGLTDTPAASQAAELLARIALASELRQGNGANG